MSAEHHIEITPTRKGSWFVTAPCGAGGEVPGDFSEDEVREYARRHKRMCCKTARVVLSSDGEEEAA
jgi:hypothetical protein